MLRIPQLDAVIPAAAQKEIPSDHVPAHRIHLNFTHGYDHVVACLSKSKLCTLSTIQWQVDAKQLSIQNLLSDDTDKQTPRSGPDVIDLLRYPTRIKVLSKTTAGFPGAQGRR